MTQVELKETATLLTVLCGLLLSALAVWKGVVKPIVLYLRRLVEIQATLYSIAEQFRPNHGSSMKDALNRLESMTVSLHERQISLANAFPVGMFEATADGDTRWINSKCSDILGLDADDAAGHGWLSAVDASDRERVADEWTNCVNHVRKFSMRYTFRNSDDVTTLCDVVAVPMKHNGKVIGWFGTMHEVRNGEAQS